MGLIRLSIALFVFSLFASAEAKDSADALQYKINVTIEPNQIKETVSVKLEAKKPIKKLLFDLSGDLKVMACRIRDQEVPFTRAGWRLELDLSKAGSPKGEFVIDFEVEGRPFNRFSKSRGGFVRTNVCPERVYIRSQYAWYPRLPDDPACYETVVKVRKDWIVRTAGVLSSQEEKGVWKFQLKHPDRRIGLVAGEYVIVEEKSKSGGKVDALVFKGHENGGEALIKVAKKAMEFFSDLYGPLREQRFTLVELPDAFGSGSGYGETGYVLIGQGAFEQETPAPWAESLAAHEVSHSWWGHEVGFEHFASEMFATYATHRYMEMANGKDAARGERQAFIKSVVSVARDKGEIDLDKIRNWGGNMDPSIYQAHAYSKSAMLLHILEMEMGRKAFDQSVKSFFENHRNQVVNFKIVSKKLAPSKHKWVISQWGKKGVPRLSVDHETKASGLSFNVQGQLLQEGVKKPFKMDVTVRAISGDKIFDCPVKVKKNKTAFKFKCPFEPERLVLDPDCHLIFESVSALNIEELTKKIFEVANSPGMGDPERLKMTIRDIKKVLTEESGSHYHTAMGRCLFRLNKLDEAVKEFEIALKGGAGGPFHRQWAYFRLGCIADLKKRRSEAESYYKKAAAINTRSDYLVKRAQKYLKTPYTGYKKEG